MVACPRCSTASSGSTSRPPAPDRGAWTPGGGSRRALARSLQPRSRKGDSMLEVGIIPGSTRPNRKSLDVAKWVLEVARRRDNAEYGLVDIKDFESFTTFKPEPHHENSVGIVLDEVVAGGEALKIMQAKRESGQT